MIEISAESACFLYLLIALSTIISIWLFQRKKGGEQAGNTAYSKTFTCEFCMVRFMGDTMKPFVRCPECHSLNKNLSKKK